MKKRMQLLLVALSLAIGLVSPSLQASFYSNSDTHRLMTWTFMPYPIGLPQGAIMWVTASIGILASIFAATFIIRRFGVFTSFVGSTVVGMVIQMAVGALHGTMFYPDLGVQGNIEVVTSFAIIMQSIVLAVVSTSIARVFGARELTANNGPSTTSNGTLQTQV